MDSLASNKMATKPVKRLMWSMGLPMVLSMVLQALYNIVDTAFVINSGEEGIAGNLALSYAFPIQILMIAIGVGTGIGINALLSRYLGEKDLASAQKVVGNGIFLSFIIFLVFFFFGLWGAKAYMSWLSKNEEVVTLGADYLTICCVFSYGSVAYAVYERFLQASGKTLLSTIAQVSGALCNIVLDYVFIYPLNMGIKGAAIATVIGQFVSLLLAMLFHYTLNKEVPNSFRSLKPDFKVIKAIYHLGLPAAIIQALLALMMLGVNLSLGTLQENAELMQGAFGIYYKIQQLPLFALFGLSNTIITIASFNYGLKDKVRVKETIKWGILDSMIIALFITIIFEVLAKNIAMIFGMASGSSGEEIISVSTSALELASIGYVFMGINVAIQGVLQAFSYTYKPLFIALGRLGVFLFPWIFLFLNLPGVTTYFWLSFPLAELLTSALSFFFLHQAQKEKVETLGVHSSASQVATSPVSTSNN